MKNTILIISFVAIYLFTGLAHANSLREQLTQFIETKSTPGMVVIVKHKGKEVFHEAIGYADVDKKEPISKEHRFKWYSMSKPVTSIAFMKAMEDKGLSIEQTQLQDIFPAFSNHSPIPVKNIATHTAGFPYGGDWKSVAGWRYWWSAPLDDSESLSEMMTTLAQLPLMNEPGEKWQYSMSQDIQGALVEQLSGSSLDNYMKENIFKVLSMKNTGFIQKGEKIARLAPMHGYDRDDKKSFVLEEQDEWDKEVLAGGSGLYGTAEDYMNFLDLFRSPNQYTHVLDEKLINEAVKNQLPKNISSIPQMIYPKSGYGYGLGVKLEDEEYLSKGSFYWAGKGGTMFWVDPAEDLAVVVMIQLASARASLEKYLIPMVYKWVESA
ncbi:serine hydrolase domain-containing protein [Arenicella sp. 4NH20-0111]|uniref:serine hydrolase domain-containing protein n=1 Tax=Arenicella sp. 4NH20-0111 TaxID=3127648 RepID=UPI0031098982